MVRTLNDLPGWAIDVGVGCVLVVAFLIFIAEPVPADPLLYLEAAQDPLNAELNPGTARLGLLIPISIVSLLFGFSETSLYVLPLIFVFLFGAATSALGRQVLGPAVGVGAALVAAAGPIILPYGTQLLPDVGAAALVTACLAFVFKASKASNQRSQRDALIAGLLLGCAYLVRETTLILAPAIFVTAWIQQIRGKQLVWMVLGVLAAPSLEFPAGWIIWDDPFFRLSAVTSRSSPLLEQSTSSQVSFDAQADFLASFKILINLLWKSVFGKLLLLGGAAFGVTAVVTRRRRYLALSAWILVAWSAFAAVGSVKPSGRLLIRLLLERYWAFLMPAFAIAVVGASAFLVKRSAEKFKYDLPLKVVSVLAAAGLVFLGGVASFDLRGDWFMRFGNDGYWQLRSSFETMPQGVQLHVEDRFSSLVSVYTNDPLGSPVTDLEIVPRLASDSRGDPEWLLISNGDQGSSSATLGDFDVPLPDEYRVFSAERDRSDWVLLTTDADRAVHSRSVLEVGGSGIEWQARRVRHGKWEDTFGLSDTPISVPAGESLIVFDSSASYGLSNSTSLVAPGVLVELSVQFHSIDGKVGVVCQFHGGSGQGDRTDVRAVSVLHGDESGGRLTSFCRAPETSGEQAVRPVLILEGPGNIHLGSGQLLTHHA